MASMPSRCIVAGCSNTPDSKRGITLHVIPFSGDDRPEAKARRKQWVDFVKLKCAKWTPLSSSTVYSSHFTPEDYTQQFSYGTRPGHPQLIRDGIGIVPVPRIVCETLAQDDKLLNRSHQKVGNKVFGLLNFFHVNIVLYFLMTIDIERCRFGRA